MEPGTRVMVDNKSSFFHGKEGKVSKRQSKPGIWVDIAATDGGKPRRLWFTRGELKVVTA